MITESIIQRQIGPEVRIPGSFRANNLLPVFCKGYGSMEHVCILTQYSVGCSHWNEIIRTARLLHRNVDNAPNKKIYIFCVDVCMAAALISHSGICSGARFQIQQKQYNAY